MLFANWDAVSFCRCATGVDPVDAVAPPVPPEVLVPPVPSTTTVTGGQPAKHVEGQGEFVAPALTGEGLNPPFNRGNQTALHDAN